MVLPSANAEQELAKLLRGEHPPLSEPAAPGQRQVSYHPPVTEEVIATGLETIGTDPTGSGTGAVVVAVVSQRIYQTLSDGATTNITLGPTASISRAIIEFRALRDTDHDWGTIDICIQADGSTVDCLFHNRTDSCGMTVSGDISGGNLRLVVTLTSTGDDLDFSATYQTVMS